MESLIVSCRAVAPIICMAILGTFLKKKGFFDEKTLSSCNNLCFKVFLPMLLFINIYNSDLQSALNGKLMLFCLASVLISFILVAVIVRRTEKQVNRQGVLIQAIFRSNFVILGIPLTKAVFGEVGTATVTMLVAAIIPLFNILAVVALEMHNLSLRSLKPTLAKILKNPLIISSVLGLLVKAIGLELPGFAADTIGDIARIATPLSIIVLGASIEFTQISKNRKPIAAGVFGKLVLVPLIEVSAAIFLGFRGIELMAVLTSCATPTAVSSFVMAKQMGGDGELAGQLVFFSSILSAVTIFLWIFVLHYFSLLS